MGYMKDFDNYTWKLFGYAYSIKIPEFVSFYTDGFKCKRCGKDIKGLLVIDSVRKDKPVICDTWNFMIFSDGIECDDCLEYDDWIRYAEYLLSNMREPFRNIEDNPDMIVNYMPREKWKLIIPKRNNKVTPFYVTGFFCKKCGKMIQGALFIDNLYLSVVDTWGFSIKDRGVECCMCSGDPNWKERVPEHPHKRQKR